MRAAAAAAMGGREKGKKNRIKALAGLSWRGFVRPGAPPAPSPFPPLELRPCCRGSPRWMNSPVAKEQSLARREDGQFSPCGPSPRGVRCGDAALCRLHCPAALCGAAAGTQDSCPGTALSRDSVTRSSAQQVLLRVLTGIVHPNYLGELPAQLEKEVSGGCWSEVCREGSKTLLDSE